MRQSFVLICSLLFSIFAFGNGDDLFEQSPIVLKRVDEPIQIDGFLQEKSWFKGEPARDFWEHFPTDTAQNVKTELYMAFDDQFLYIGGKCFAPNPNYITPSLRRDYRAGGSDNITLLFDTFNDGTNAFVFGINPFGVLREALIANGGQDSRRDWTSSWDNKWTGEAKIQGDHWSFEIAIPFSSLRFQEGGREWRFNSYRFDTQTNTQTTWIRIPRNQSIISMGYMGKMLWDEPLKKSGSNISVIPFVTAGSSKNFEEEGKPVSSDFDFGGDAKIAITPGLNLDLTVNPDFSQVEVDQQVLNLERFEVFFPERRQFFLENADLFGGFGDATVNPFFSRRIGSARVLDEEGEESTIANPIRYGARLNGKINNNWRVGLLNMQTAREDKYNLPDYNYSVAAVQRKVFSRSNLGLIFVNKKAMHASGDTSGFYSPYNRVMGLDYNLASADNQWTGKFYLHRSFTDADVSGQFAHGARLELRKRLFTALWQHQSVGEGYVAEVGFVRRHNYFCISPELEFNFFPNKGSLNEHGPELQTDMFWRPGFGKTDHEIRLSYRLEFRNRARLRVGVTNEYTFLFEDFDPTRSDDEDVEPLPGGKGYTYTRVGLSYDSDRRRRLSYEIEPFIGEFFNGRRYGLEGQLNYRYQPYGTVAMSFNYSYINLPSPYASTDLLLVGPRIDLTFSKNIFLTTFIQYNNQADNVNINARFQWRFAPVSDFFLVYTDNYYSTDFKVKTRGLVMKMTYWLNM